MHRPSLGPDRIDWGRDLLDRQLKHLTRLIDDLLDVRRITSGRVRLQREPLDLESVLRHRSKPCALCRFTASHDDGASPKDRSTSKAISSG